MDILMPYPNMRLSIHVISTAHLGQQYMQACDMLRCSLVPNRPRPLQFLHIMKLWRPYPGALLQYADWCWEEMEIRNQSSQNPRPKSESGMVLSGLPQATLELPFEMPDFVGWERMHASYRQWMLYKDIEWYQQYGWDEIPFAIQYLPGLLPEVGETVLETATQDQYIVMRLDRSNHLFSVRRDDGNHQWVSYRQFYSRDWERTIVRE